MKIPYGVLRPCGKILFAARGGKIHSFGVENGSYRSTWKHPDVQKAAEAMAPKADASTGADSVKEPAEQEEPQEDGPPAKRQRTEEPKEAGAMEIDEAEKVEAAQDDRRKGGFKNWKQKKDEKDIARRDGQTPKPTSRKAPEQPIITHLVATSTGAHLVAVSGHDKTIWVFEHDGDGNLKQLTQRPMPKRPCAALISPDDTTIFSADKFGDVYTLPLIPSEASEVALSASSTPTPAAQKPWKPEATNLTVHSRRNLEALKQQQLQAARQSSTQDQPEKPTFEHTLIIGHVSLLTDMCFAEKDGRRYILTADRDEHIRLSRYIPQAHIIEGFCLGHKNFITAMAVPAGRPELLVSGGGDDELFLWDWLANKVVSKFNLLNAAQKFQEGTSKIAVSQIHTAAAVDAQGGPTTAVLVICEGVPAVFVLTLSSSSSELIWTETIPFTGNPLHLATVANSDGSLERILVATDAGDSGEGDSHVSALNYAAGNTTFETNYQLTDVGLSDEEADLTVEQVRRLVFGAEDLRKHPFDATYGAGGEEEAAPEEP